MSARARDWRIGSLFGDGRRTEVIDHTPRPARCVALVYTHHDARKPNQREARVEPDPEGMANLAMVIAAPAMLAALERLTREVELLSAAVTPNELRAAEKQARAAIAQARGDS